MLIPVSSAGVFEGEHAARSDAASRNNKVFFIVVYVYWVKKIIVVLRVLYCTKKHKQYPHEERTLFAVIYYEICSYLHGGAKCI